MVPAKCLENLKRGKRFGSGQPCDRGGAPRGKRLSTLVREVAARKIRHKDLDGITRDMPTGKALAVTLIARGLEGDTKALELLFSYLMEAAPAEEDCIGAALDPACLAILEAAGIRGFSA